MTTESVLGPDYKMLFMKYAEACHEYWEAEKNHTWTPSTYSDDHLRDRAVSCMNAAMACVSAHVSADNSVGAYIAWTEIHKDWVNCVMRLRGNQPNSVGFADPITHDATQH